MFFFFNLKIITENNTFFYKKNKMLKIPSTIKHNAKKYFKKKEMPDVEKKYPLGVKMRTGCKRRTQS